MVCAVPSAEIRDVILHNKIDSVNNSFESLTVIIVLGLVVSMFVCAIPFKISSVVISVADGNNNTNYIRRYDEQAEINCPICLENIVELQLFNVATCIRISCGHLYCSDCIQRIINTERNNCPVCNLEIPPNSLVQVQLT